MPILCENVHSQPYHYEQLAHNTPTNSSKNLSDDSMEKYADNQNAYTNPKNQHDVLTKLKAWKEKWSSHADKAHKLVPMGEKILKEPNLTAQNKADIQQLIDTLIEFQNDAKKGLTHIDVAIKKLSSDSKESYDSFMKAHEIWLKYPNADRDFDVNLPD